MSQGLIDLWFLFEDAPRLTFPPTSTTLVSATLGWSAVPLSETPVGRPLTNLAACGIEASNTIATGWLVRWVEWKVGWPSVEMVISL